MRSHSITPSLHHSIISFARPALLLTLALLLFLPLLGSRDVVTSHEARVVQTARQMAAVGWPWERRTVAVPVVELREVDGRTELTRVPQKGTRDVNPWLVPVFNGSVRLHKPPLPYWCAAVLFRVIGFGEGAARLPGAVMGAVSVLLVYDLGRMLTGRRGGWYAGLAYVSSYFVFDEYRKAMADPYLAFFSLAAVWAWVRGAEGKWRSSGVAEWWSKRPVDRQRTPSLHHSITPSLLFYVSLALGALSKAPVNFLHVGLALAAYHLCYRRRPPGRWWHHGVGVGLMLAVAGPWPVYILRHVPQALQVWRYESLGEFADNVEKARRWWFYLPQVPLIAAPWTIVALVGLVGAVMRVVRRGRVWLARDRRALFPAAWFVASLVVFSASNVKKNAYLLPAMPAVSLMTAYGLVRLVAGVRRGARGRGWAEALVNGHVVAGMLAGLVVPVLAWRTWPHPGPGPTAGARVVLGLVSLAGALVLGGGPFLAWTRRGGRAWVAAQAVVFAVATTAFFDFVGRPSDNQRSARAVCAEVEEQLRRPDTTLLTTSLPEEASVYLPLGVAFDPAKSRVLVVVDDRAGAARNDADWFEDRIAGRRVTEVERLPVDGRVAQKPRWKLYAVTVERRWLARGE